MTVQFQLTEAEYEALQRVARRTGKSQEELLRQAAQSLILGVRQEEPHPQQRTPSAERSLSGLSPLQELRSDLTAW